jgi:Arc/MetJ-type ribon-helix-helix transcriptional regulator
MAISFAVGRFALRLLLTTIDEHVARIQSQIAIAPITVADALSTRERRTNSAHSME